MSEYPHRLPELLCPAGSPAALDAAIDGGADAVYFGASAFNARLNAQNFTPEQLKEQVAKAHIYGVKMYMTMNTLIYDRECEAFLRTTELAYNAGVDALIVADIGGAEIIHRYIPDMPLHASTQMTAHNTAAATELYKRGFSRVVLAREMSLDDIKTFTATSPIAAEVFIHGALCVSCSGQCLFSSLVGGRSGNRGECAQPCRLPYTLSALNSNGFSGERDGARARVGSGNGKGNGNERRNQAAQTRNARNSDAPPATYPLSLKDLCLAASIPELIAAGVSSLKIEGRMKSPEYVAQTAKIWRRLLDEERAATEEELSALADIFSRGGFTDGYFKGKTGTFMLGVRSDKDKEATRAAVLKQNGITKKLPLWLCADISDGKPAEITLTARGCKVSATGDVPLTAQNAPLDRAAVEKSLTKFGSTPFVVSDFSLTLGEGLMLPVSSLNALRRNGAEKLCSELSATGRDEINANENANKYISTRPEGRKKSIKSARFYDKKQITASAREYFDIIYMPLERCLNDGASLCNGVIIPPVVYDSERENVLKMLNKARECGALHAMCAGLGQLSLAKEAGFITHADFRFNATNTEAVAALEKYGFDDILLSPELTLPQIRDISGSVGAVVYGRIPLMLLEKCILRDMPGGCKSCGDGNGKAVLNDRLGARFPVIREYLHRNSVFNSVVLYMADRNDALNSAGIRDRHFIFTVETAQSIDKIIECHKKNLPPNAAGFSEVRRIKA